MITPSSGWTEKSRTSAVTVKSPPMPRVAPESGAVMVTLTTV